MGLLDTLTGMLGASTTSSNERAVLLARKAFEASGHLADVIPQIIDKLTPGGKVPDSSLLNGALDALRSSWGQR